MIRCDMDCKGLIDRFYGAYIPLSRRYGIRMNSYFDMHGNNRIDIWEYDGDIRGRCICHVSETSEGACYARAFQYLMQYEENQRGGTA